MLGRLIPRDEGYFELFNQLAAHLTNSSRKLRELLGQPARQAELVREVKEIEHAADVLMHGLTQRLDQSFVTPIDREDIHLLASRLDDVIDLVDGSARRAEMFNITDVRDPATRLGDVLARATAELEKAVGGMKRADVVKERTRNIKTLEEEGDAIYHQAVGDLFRTHSANPIEVLKWKEMYDTLERTIDATQAAATALQSISLKHA